MLKSTVPDTVKALTSWGSDVTIRREFGKDDEAIEWCQNLNDDVKTQKINRNITIHSVVSPDKNYRVALVAYVDRRRIDL